IRETEWKPADGGVEFPVDGTPIRITGRIDRIDWNPGTKQWALWDYKTGESVSNPRTAHVAGDGSWRDLQLPLYCLLAVELLGDAEPAEIGYIALPRDPAGIQFMNVENWGRTKSDPVLLPEALDEAFEAARDVVRRIRKGEFFTVDGFDPGDPIFEAIGGVGIVAGAEEEGEE
ncbi:MAG: PD-(D/E)XK nuclease family protein, partial [Deltaproteobacteria bacterium]|nr:PD-(D/E)XK nuclease family protein [Deltaproteobacteria bacterium]